MTTTVLDLARSERPDRTSPVTGRLWASFLRTPLLVKLLGAKMMVLVTALATGALFWNAASSLQITAPLVLSVVITSGLVWLALQPIAELEETAARVAAGDFSARVPMSRLADRDMQRLATTMNRLLDRVDADRAQIQYLAGRSARARDIERESVARELRDSFAQVVAGIALQLAAVHRKNLDPQLHEPLQRVRELIAHLNEEMKGVAETLYPGTLGEFGLLNALEALARRVRRHAGVAVEVDGSEFAVALTAQRASALYRAADEALRNVVQHAHAKHARVTLRSEADEIVMQIEDDGRGVDLRTGDPLQAGLGLFSARAVLALAGGTLQISSAPSRGTRVVARVPVGGAQ